MDVTPKRVILDLLSTVGERSMAVGALVGAGRVFGFAENSMRVALTRLRAAGMVQQDEPGRYRLGKAAAAVGRQVASWRSVEERVREWDGGWLAVLLSALPRSARRARRHSERALRLLGFRPLTRDLHLRPDNLAGGAGELRARLRDLGLDRAALVFRIDALDAETERRARSLWDGTALSQRYRSLRKGLERSERRLARMAPQQAMLESFSLGGEVIRSIVLDPLLPEPLVSRAARAALVGAMRRYDEAGRRCWSAYLRAPQQKTAPTRPGSAHKVPEHSPLARGVA